MFVRIFGKVKDENNKVILDLGNEQLIVETTEVDDSQCWHLRIKTCVTGDYYIRYDSWSNILLIQGMWVKLKKNNKKVMVSSASTVEFRYTDASGKTVRSSYLDKDGKLTFEVCNRPKSIGVEFKFNEFSHNYDCFLKQMGNQYYKGQSQEVYIRKNFIQYYLKKNGLVNLLRNHPNWNENEKAVITKAIVGHRPELATANASLRTLLQNGVTGWKDESSLRAYKYIVDHYNMFIINEQNNVIFYTYMTDHINKILSRSYCVDTKPSKIIRYLCDNFAEKNENFEKLYAKFSDSISTTKKEIKFVVSANICDFVTMSHGNSWTSCHSFRNRGQWHCGSLSYANDYSTLVAYGVDPQVSNVDIYDAPKIFRNLFMLSEDQTEYIQSRTYPANNTFGRTDINELFYKVLTECGAKIDIENHISGAGKYSNGKGFLQYPDYQYSTNADRYGGNCSVITIGGAVYSLGTGRTLSSGKYMSNAVNSPMYLDVKFDIVSKRSRKKTRYKLAV